MLRAAIFTACAVIGFVVVESLMALDDELAQMWDDLGMGRLS